MSGNLNCASCTKWVTLRAIDYDNGMRIVTYQPPLGRGFCEEFKREEPHDFGCVRHEQAGQSLSGMRITNKSGKPSDHWTMIACPDCAGAGSMNSRACRRCSGTGSVRRYDDGYIADETWDHPVEKARKAALRIAPKIDPNTELRPLPGAHGGALGSGEDVG